MVEKQEPKLYQQQVYDSTFKSLLEDQPQEMLSLLVEGIEYVHELSESAQKPSLRVDRVYQVLYLSMLHILHIEFETDAHSEMPLRMLEYYGILYRKHKKPIIPLVICPFRTDIADPPLEIKGGDETVLTFHYRVIRLWEYNAQKYLDKHVVGIYALLPTMQGANYQVLADALDEMKEWYAGRTKQLATHVLWFGTCLKRSDTVSHRDKERILEKMKDFDSLLDENPFVQKTKAEAEERGRAEGEIQGEVRGLQKAVVIIVEGRFPPLTELAQQRVTQISQPDLLNVLLKQVATARDEDMARLLLNSFAA